VTKPVILVVDDDQEVSFDEVLDGHDRGQSRIRSEAPAYKWNTPKSGDVPAKLEPFPLFNDALDVARGAAASLWPQVEELTTQEILEQRVEARMAPEEVQTDVQGAEERSNVPDGRQIARAVVYAQEVRKMQGEYDIDEFGFDREPDEVSDITDGW